MHEYVLKGCPQFFFFHLGDIYTASLENYHHLPFMT